MRRRRRAVKVVKAKEVHNLADDELDKKLSELEEELFNLRFQRVGGQLENPMRMRQVRRDIARIKTIQRQRELSPADAS